MNPQGPGKTGVKRSATRRAASHRAPDPQHDPLPPDEPVAVEQIPLLPPDSPDHEPGHAVDPYALAELSQRCAELEVRLDVAESERWHARAVLTQLPQPVIVTDPFDDVVLLSASAARHFGGEPGYGGFGPLSALVRDIEFTALVTQVRELHSRGTRRPRRVILTTLQGPVAFDATLICVCDQRDGRPSPWGVVTILQEVTRSESDGRTLALSAQAELSAGLAHEFRTPLASIRAYTELLLDQEARDPETRREFLSVIAAETDRLSRLVENMDLLSRVESGQARPRSDRVDPVLALLGAVAVMAPQARSAGVTLATTDLPPSRDDLRVLGDQDLLQQALLNLLSNAIKFSARGGEVRVALHPFRDRVELSVTDAGPGIDPVDLPHVFTKFYRSRTHAARAAGSGLGLALVRSVVEQVHRGTVSLESRPGMGTRAVVDLPLAPPTPVAPAKLTPHPRKMSCSE